jgi:hypothetical protein
MPGPLPRQKRRAPVHREEARQIFETDTASPPLSPEPDRGVWRSCAFVAGSHPTQTTRAAPSFGGVRHEPGRPRARATTSPSDHELIDHEP